MTRKALGCKPALGTAQGHLRQRAESFRWARQRSGKRSLRPAASRDSSCSAGEGPRWDRPALSGNRQRPWAPSCCRPRSRPRGDPSSAAPCPGPERVTTLWAPLLLLVHLGPSSPAHPRNGWPVIPGNLSRNLLGTMTASRTQSEVPWTRLPPPYMPCWSLPEKGQKKQKPPTFTEAPAGPQGPLRQVPLTFWVADTSPSAPQAGAQPGRWGGPSLHPRGIRLCPSMHLLPAWSSF